MLHNVLLVLFSFTCSTCFGVTFHIRPQALFFAGLAGAITRTALLLSQSCISNRFVYTLLAAMVGALYAELIAGLKQTPITKFLYPAFVPIIPGDLLYNTVVSLMTGAYVDCAVYVIELAQALMGLALGGMLVPMVVHSKRYWKALFASKFGPKQAV
jgi:uncharacterized membrane protein YjjB (DUF3815 family)